MQRKIQDVEENISAPVLGSASLRTIEEGENDSGTETLHDTDSEPEDQQSKQENLIEEFTGLNVSIGYSELHMFRHSLLTTSYNDCCLILRITRNRIGNGNYNDTDNDNDED